MWWSGFGMGVSLLLSLLSFMSFVPPLPTALVIACFVGVAPAMGSGLSGARRRGVPLHGAEFIRGLPPWLSLVAAFAFVSFFTAQAGLPGPPEIHHGQYYFDNHGSLIPTTLAEYQRGLRGQQRVFTSIPAVFYAVAFSLHRQRR
jgi:energy-coupling factor transporter transmembrane protein EcfT